MKICIGSYTNIIWDSFYAANFNSCSDTSRMTTRCIYIITCYWLDCQWILCQLTNSNFYHDINVRSYYGTVLSHVAYVARHYFTISDACDIACIWYYVFTISKPLWTLVNALCNVISENNLWKTASLENGFKSIVCSGKSHQ